MKKEIIETDAKIITLTTVLNKKWLGNEKADVWICGFWEIEDSFPAKCSNCGKKVFYTTHHLEMLKDNAIKICPECALTVPKYSKGLPQQLKEVLETWKK